MGILLAYALLTMILHAYNSSEKKQGRIISKPISASNLQESPAVDIMPIGIMPKVRDQQDVEQSDHWEIDVSESTLDMEMIVPIFMRSLKKHRIMKLLQLMGLSRLQKCTLHFEEFHTYTHTDTCENNFSDTLCDCGLQLQSVPPDGNCFFYLHCLKYVVRFTSLESLPKPGWSH